MCKKKKKLLLTKIWLKDFIITGFGRKGFINNNAATFWDLNELLQTRNRNKILERNLQIVSY